MKQQEKIIEIVRFVKEHPESTASRVILRRNFLADYNFETSSELGIRLENVLKEKDNEEIESLYYLVK